MSRSLQLSLGMVNCFVKRLVRKGYFKITTFPPRRAKYMLTRKGLAEKCRLAQEYLEYSLCYFKNIRQALSREVEKLKGEGLTKIALVGTGELAELTYLTLREHGMEVVLAGDLDAQRTQFLGHAIVPPEKLMPAGCQAVLIALVQGGEEAVKRLSAAGFPAGQINLISGQSSFIDAQLAQDLPLTSLPQRTVKPNLTGDDS
ncbi:hypothetical protein AAU61_01150 [Desulfocarbo indianensis]|nr:hypothetical protein AAU61_01150 [Desulfocarbo indianensis]